ncbi:MAG: BamA/TamA family outer membrane protein, partial [Chitinophagaceae bacterium]|nr:BamA/TamA family outer membrane protein [Chitinophagaceae bacterium]
MDTTAPGVASVRFYPTLGYSPETSFEIGLSALLLYRAKNDTLNRLSEVNAFSFITLESQYGIWVDNALYGDKDKWFVLGRSRWQKFPLLYYGTGPDTKGDDPAIVEGNYLLLRQRVMRKIIPNLFLGPEVDFQKLYGSSFEQPDNLTYPLPTGSEGSSNLGLGLALVYDNRHNVLNVRKGLFTELSFLDYNEKFGSTFDFRSINVDLRSYYPLKQNRVLAWQVAGNFMSGNIPFNQLALMGGETLMRGYYQGRYR